MLINPYIQFLIASVMLITGSEFLISNSKLIAERYNISKFVIGITVLAFGTSLPELVVSISAMLNVPPQGDIVIGNVIGSNIANITLVFAIVVILKPIQLEKNSKLFYNLFSLLSITILFCLFLRYYHMGLTKWEGYSLLLSLSLYFFILFSKFARDKIEGDYKNKLTFINIVLLIGGFILLKYGADLFIDSSLDIAEILGFKTIAISMTLVALGTSLPELMTSLIAIYKNEKALAIGNIIGSNIINISFVAGISSIISNIDIDYNYINSHINILLIVTASIVIFSILNKKIGRIIGSIYLFVYLYFIMINFIKTPLI